jgi:hypothetical protein
LSPRKKHKAKSDPTQFDGLIETQEVHIEASGMGTKNNPRTIGAAIELSGTLAKPHGIATRFEVIVYERSPSSSLVDADFGNVSAVKPNVRIYLYVDKVAMDRLVMLASAKRLSLMYATSEKPHYGRAEIVRWSMRTALEIGEEDASQSQ